MIDTVLINKAVEQSPVIRAVDYSWRNYLEALKSSLFTIPFPGEYKMQVDNHKLLVEGYHGSLIIDKLYYNRNTYLLKEPIEEQSFSIYGVYDSKGKFMSFTTEPVIGFHYLGLTNSGYTPVCVGDIQYTYPDIFELLKKACLKIAESFRLINMHSLGSVFLPDKYSELKEIFLNQDRDSYQKFEQLVSKNLIKELL